MHAHIYVLGLHSAKGNCLSHRKISLFRCIFLMCKMPKRENSSSYINPITPGFHKMVKHTLKILKQMLQDFQNVFHHFLDARHYRVNACFLLHFPTQDSFS